MGGRGSGGRRTGSGQKPRIGVVVPHPSSAAAAVPIARVDPPAEWQATPGQFAALTADLVFLQDAASPGEPNPQIAALQARLDELTARAFALAIWHELAPHALAAGTLTDGTVGAFMMLCRAVVHERALSALPGEAGGANHRGLMHRVATWLKDFGIAPLGKPMARAASVATPTLSKWGGALK